MLRCIQIGLTLAVLLHGASGCGEPVANERMDSGTYADDPGAAEATSLLGRPLYAAPPAKDRAKQGLLLREAEDRLRQEPNDPDAWVWVGRRLGYLWRMNDAIDAYTRGIARHPKDAALYRHRGHRYITVRQFDKAIDDLRRAARLMDGLPDVVEQDGLPNAKNIPLTTLQFNVWYHLGVTNYLKGNFSAALDAFERARSAGAKYDDNVVAVTDWMYMALRRMGRDEEATALLVPINENMEIIENHAYYKRLLMYKGRLRPEELLDTETATDLDLATMGYGVGNWYFCGGNKARAREIFEKVVAGGYWPAFGYIAAEADLARMRAK